MTGHSRGWIAAFTVAGALLFAGWWSLVALVASLGTCGEDSDLDEDRYVQLCGTPGGDHGRIYEQLLGIAGGAVLAILVLGGLAIAYRRWWPALLLWAVLLGAGIGAFAVAGQ
jgi:hypothetical protein